MPFFCGDSGWFRASKIFKGEIYFFNGICGVKVDLNHHLRTLNDGNGVYLSTKSK